ncbi:hypothetical protein ES703_50909 [subsurface metagenome]
MNTPIKHIVSGCLVKFTSIVDKRKEEIITSEQTQDLVQDLIHNTAAEMTSHIRAGFVTDN